MSRSYRISVRESVHKTIKAEDSVCTELEILEVLPPEQMAGLLSDELQKQGFEKEGEVLVRREGDVTITVDPSSGKVTVAAEKSETAKVEQERHGRAYDDIGPHASQVRESLRQEAQRDIDKVIQDKTSSLQGKVTDQLEGKLGDLRGELDQVVNRVTAEALKRKAASLGQIKEISEDQQTGSLTIVVEV